MPKSVLVVDDSRVAMAALRRMLEHQGLMVDAAESGEEAIEFLRSNPQPSALFLDHMMPGMDGFQTLAVIKKDTRFGLVPIVMYTSQEGESYMSQALARGAYDVLRKPLRPLELVRILQRLNLLRAPEPVIVPTVPLAAAIPETPEPSYASARPPNAEPPGATVAPADAPAAPRPVPYLEPTQAPADADGAEPGRAPAVRRFFYVVLIGALLVWYFAGKLPTERSAPPAQTTAAKAERPTTRRASEPAGSPVTPSPTALPLLETLSWALNLNNQYGYNQLPFDDQRLALVRELAGRLAQTDFRGVIRLDAHVGEFCLARDGFGGFKLPDPQTRISECEVVKYTVEDAAALGRRQSPAFARYVASQASVRGAIKIEIASHGTAQPAVDYPDYATTPTAGEWNAVAQRNNRVQIFIVPAR